MIIWNQTSKNSLQLSVTSPNSGEGIENINAQFNFEDMTISFNSKYLIDINIFAKLLIDKIWSIRFESRFWKLVIFMQRDDKCKCSRPGRGLSLIVYRYTSAAVR